MVTHVNIIYYIRVSLVVKYASNYIYIIIYKTLKCKIRLRANANSREIFFI